MRILVISAHPDDETLGCGGVLLRHGEQGDSLYWVVATQGHEPQWSAETLRVKSAEVDQVAAAYGMQKVFRLGFPTVRLDAIAQSDLIDKVRTAINEVKPSVIYLIHSGDIHTDHYALFTAAMSVLKPFHMAALGVKRVLCFETLSSTDAAPPQIQRVFAPNVFCDVSQYIDRKLEIMSLFKTEVQAEPLPRSESAIRALARYRGATIGVPYAEAFMLVRELM